MTLRRNVLFAGAALAASLLSGCASGPDPETDGPLYFMVGCWRSPDGLAQETWSSPQGGVMFGHAQTFQDGRMVTFEQSRIDLRTRPATFVVAPNGQRAITFVQNPEAGAAEPPAVVFENAQNEFPQRVAYRRTDKGLTVTVSQVDGSRSSEVYRERCDD